MSESATTEKQLAPAFPDELLASEMFLLKRLGMAAKERSMPVYEAAGVHPYHHSILAVLDRGSCATQGTIAEALDYDKSQLVGLLDELEEDGLVERRRDPSDRRRQIVKITPAGRKALERMRRLSKQLGDVFLAPLDAEERRELHGLLVRLAAEHLPHTQR